MPERFWREPMPDEEGKALLVEEVAKETAGATPPAVDPRIPALFHAVAFGDIPATKALLDEGVDVNASLPLPADKELVERFRGTRLHYFVTVESGVTPLMLAAGRGHTEMVRLLLDAGASPTAKTKRHRTFALWLAGKGGYADIMQMLLGVTPDSDAARMEVRVDLSGQTATLVRDGIPQTPVPISSGRSSFPTPPGEYVITDKHKKWRSTIYPADMPFFMRFSCGDIGFHAGNLPGYPASHGCIRLRKNDAREFFETIPIGTRVVIH